VALHARLQRCPTAGRATSHPATPAGVFALRLERIAESPTLRHLLGTNQFFVDLAAYALQAGWPNANVYGGNGLDKWRSEREITAV
jgi:hypothetical protein